MGCIARVLFKPVAQPIVIYTLSLHDALPISLVHEVLSRLRTTASSKLPSGLCAGSAAPVMSTLPAESMTTSEDRARALRAAASDVAAPTASAAFPNNPRRLTA